MLDCYWLHCWINCQPSNITGMCTVRYILVLCLSMWRIQCIVDSYVVLIVAICKCVSSLMIDVFSLGRNVKWHTLPVLSEYCACYGWFQISTLFSGLWYRLLRYRYSMLVHLYTAQSIWIGLLVISHFLHQDLSMGGRAACWALCGICPTRDAGNINTVLKMFMLELFMKLYNLCVSYHWTEGEGRM